MPLFVTGGEKLAELVESFAFLRVRGTRSNRSFLLPASPLAQLCGCMTRFAIPRSDYGNEQNSNS